VEERRGVGVFLWQRKQKKRAERKKKKEKKTYTYEQRAKIDTKSTSQQPRETLEIQAFILLLTFNYFQYERFILYSLSLSGKATVSRVKKHIVYYNIFLCISLGR
jgi:hypothetical protein